MNEIRMDGTLVSALPPDSSCSAENVAEAAESAIDAVDAAKVVGDVVKKNIVKSADGRMRLQRASRY